MNNPLPFELNEVYLAHTFYLHIMVNVAQMVEHQIVALVAVGSIPTIHPTNVLFLIYEVPCLAVFLQALFLL